MLNEVMQVVKPGVIVRPMVDWIRFVTLIKLRTEHLKTLFIKGAPHYSRCINTFTHILNRLDIDELMLVKDDYTKYALYIDKICNSHKFLFDPVYMSGRGKNIFTINENIPEFILNVTMERPLSSLPMNEGWDKWERTIPVRLLYHDSTELVTDMTKFGVMFKKIPATHCIYSIDLSVLLFKYFKYAEYQIQRGEKYTITKFIHYHIIPSWFEDSRRIWLFNIVSKMLTNVHGEMNIETDSYITIESMLPTIKSDITKIYNDMQKNTLSVGDILKFNWFGDGQDIYTWLQQLRDTTILPNLRQYKYLDFLSTLPYIKFIMRLASLIHRPDVIMLNRKLFFILDRYMNQRLWMNINNSQFRNVVEKEVTSLYADVKDKVFL